MAQAERTMTEWSMIGVMLVTEIDAAYYLWIQRRAKDNEVLLRRKGYWGVGYSSQQYFFKKTR
jgi:hypothetical protein